MENEISTCKESMFSSNLDKYKSNGTMNLDLFRCEELTEDIRIKYKSKINYLIHVNSKKDNGLIYFDQDDNIAAFFSVKGTPYQNDPEKNIWIENIYVSPKYRGYHLTKQILDICINKYNANALGVNKKNEIAIKAYQKYGFEIFQENDKNYLMKLKNIVKEGYCSDLDIQRQEFDDTPVQTGFMDEKSKRWNSLVTFNNKNYRERCEVLIIKDNKIFFAKKGKNDYKIPGGSTEPDKPISAQAIREVQEEARINIKNIRYYMSYRSEYKFIPDWVRKFHKDKQWVGHYNHLFVADYDGKYTGKVESVDKDPFIYNNGKFYEIDKVIDYVKPEFKFVLDSINNNYKKDNHFYFYHFAPKNINKIGIISPKYMYEHGMNDLFRKSTYKYRDRLVNTWGYYKDKIPEELTDKEIFDGINKFRKSDSGLSYIYFFRYPPYEKLGPKMKAFLKTHDCYRIDLNDPDVKKEILDINWNKDMSHSDGKRLNEEYYKNISFDDYFKRYNDSAKLNFAALNHIAIRFKDDYCPLNLLEKVNLEELSIANESFLFSKKDIRFNVEKWGTEVQYNILWITGLSGSGKSTLAEEYSNGKNVKIIHLDEVMYNFDKDYWFNEYLSKRIPEYNKIVEEYKRNGVLIMPIKQKLWTDIINEIIKYSEILFKNGKRLIAEGIQVFRDIPAGYISGRPLIIKETSIIKSLLRAFKRDGLKEYGLNDLPFGEFMKELKKTIHEWMVDDKYKNALRYFNESYSSIPDNSTQTLESFKIPSGIIMSYLTNEELKAINEVKKSLSENDKKYLAGSDDLENFDNEDPNDYAQIYKNIHYIDNKPVGYIVVEQHKAYLGAKYFSVATAVNPKYRNKGIAYKLMQDMIKTLKSLNKDIILTYLILKENNASRKLALKVGFRMLENRLTAKAKTDILLLDINHPDRLANDIIKEVEPAWATEALGDIEDSKHIIDNFSSLFNISSINRVTKNLLSIHDNIKTFDISSLFTKVNVKNHRIEIEGINFKRLLLRMEETYGTKKILNILGKEYNKYDEYLFKNKKITRAKMRITKFVVHEFFALELFNILAELEDLYNDSNYRKICGLLLKKTWIGNIGKSQIDKLDIKRLNNLTYTLQPYQKEFIENYPLLKNILGLNGHILAFEQGLGKTLTSISLAECMNKEKVYILCPNKLTGNWVDEIKSYYKKYQDNNETYLNEVFVLNGKANKISNKAKFIITNYENIKGMMEHAEDCDNMLIIDESHNFRNMKGSRVKELLDLKSKLNCKDVLLCSGTPIKASPSEIVPSLLMIDPIFDMEAAEIYTKCFSINSTTASNIIKTRFGYVMYRKDKSELSLPEKFITNMKVSIKNADKYALKTIRDQVSIRFREIYEEKVKHNQEKQDIFVKYLKKYSSASISIYKLYYNKMVVPANSEIMVDMHESEKEIISTYIDTYVIPNVPKEELKGFNRAYTEYIRMRQSAIGLALGEILPKARTDMYIAMYEENKEKFINIIENNDKKTVIFSQFKQVVDYICDDLNNYGIGTVKVTGNVKNAYDNIKRFKEDGAIDVIVATSQTMGTGQTLIEANKMFFFGPPWRSTDFDQCCDRIHRIGQTTPVYIHNVILDTEFKNLSSRMHDILDWSNNMFSGYITDNLKEDVEKIVTESNIQTEVIDKFEILERKFNTISTENFNNSGEDIFLNNIRNLFNNIPIQDDYALEEAKYDDTNKYPVFVVLMHSGTVLANIIKKVTNDQFSHACISFNSKLNPLYSFGRKKIDSDPGFAINNPKTDFYQKFKTKYSVYVIFVSKQDLYNMKKRLKYFIDNQDKLKYDLFGLVFNYFNLTTNSKRNYFCSRFVAEVIGSAKTLDMHPSLYRPQDLSYLPEASLIIEGDDISKYDYRKTELNLKKFIKS